MYVLKYLNEVIIAEITTQGKGYPTEIFINQKANLSKPSFVRVSVMRFLKNRPDIYSGLPVTRRDCLRYFIHGWGLLLTGPLFLAKTAVRTNGPSILGKYLGEELSYQIGFWLIDHCGDAKTSFIRTDLPDIYRISLEGHGVGFINFLLGGVKYSYSSFCQYLPDIDRLRPVYFKLKKKRGDKEDLRSITFDYAAGEIEFLKSNPTGKTRIQSESMKADQIYEDYLTLFYNFRHGYYGPIERDRKFLLPLYTKKQMQPVKLQIADLEKEKQFRSQEFNKIGKHFFMQFQINPEDVSSGSGEIKGWMSSDAIPVKGTIEDVVFFGDLWGELKERKVLDSAQRVKIPDTIKNNFQPAK